MLFKTKQAAASFYEKHNNHLRSLNAYGTWRSDLDPKTKLLYVVRDFENEHLAIPPFSSTPVEIADHDEIVVKKCSIL